MKGSARNNKESEILSNNGPAAEESELIDFHRNSIRTAEEVIDKVCAKGGRHLYETYYIKPKLRPFAAKKHQYNMAEVATQMSFPGDFGEAKVEIVKGQDGKEKLQKEFKADAWADEEEPSAPAVEAAHPRRVQVHYKPPAPEL